MAQVGDWVLNRPHGVGRVVAIDGRTLTVEFRHGREEVTSRTRSLSPDSLDVQAYLDPEWLQRRLDQEALAVALDILREAPHGLSSEQIRARAVSLGADKDTVEVWWEDVEQLLRTHPEVSPPPDHPGRWALTSAVTPTGPSVQDLLERLCQKRLKGSERAVICSQLAEYATAGILSPSDAAAAAVLGCHDLPTRASLDDIEPRGLPASVVQTLVEKVDEDDVSFLVRAALTARGEQTAAHAADRARTFNRGATVMMLLSNRLDDEAASLHATDDAAGAAPRLTAVVTRAARLAVGAATPRFVTSIIRLHLASQHAGSSSKEVTALLTAVDSLLESSRPSASDVERSVAEEPMRSVTARALGKVMATATLAPGSPRLAFLEGLWRAGRQDAVLAPETWPDLDVRTLGRVIDEPLIRTALLGTGSGRHVVGTSLARELQGLNREVLATLILHSDLVEYCPQGPLDSYLAALAGRHPAVRRLGEGLVRQVLTDAERSARERAASVEQRHAAELARASEQEAQLEKQLAEAKEQLDFAHARLQRGVAQADSATRAELRQARVEGLRAAVDLLGELERRSSGQPALLESLVTVAAVHGLRRLGLPGQVEPFSADIHRVVGGQSSDDVQVVESGWIFEFGDERIVLKHVLVRPLEE